MTLVSLKKKKLPDAPGVYFFRDARRKILYIGKATSLRERVRSYFGADLISTRGPLLTEMVRRAKNIDWEVTDSVLEAIILEANLIRRHRPLYNSIQKDDKSFNYVVITDEAYPLVKVVRGRELHQGDEKQKGKYVFGPFPHGLQFKSAIKIIRRIFPYRDQKCTPGQGRPCFNRQIGLCPGVCTGEISRTEYGRGILHLKLFFEGKKKELVRTLERDMKAFARERAFEHAEEVRKKLFALRHIEDVSLIKEDLREYGATGVFRIEAYDVAHLSGKEMVGVMTVVENGETKKMDYRKFTIRSVKHSDDTAALREVLSRRLTHEEWPLPDLIVVDGGKAQKNTAEAVLLERKFPITVVGVVKDEHHRPREVLGDKVLRGEHEKEILLANSEAHRFAISWHRERRRKRLLS